jgi:hypothetical protein
MRDLLTQIVDGDCRSWVLNCDSGDLLGHLVSGYSKTGIGYVIPAEQIFRHISNALADLSNYPLVLEELPVVPRTENP